MHIHIHIHIHIERGREMEIRTDGKRDGDTILKKKNLGIPSPPRPPRPVL